MHRGHTEPWLHCRDWAAAQARAAAASADATVRRGAGDAAGALQRSASWAGETAHTARHRAAAAAADASRTASEAWQRTFRVRLVRRGSRVRCSPDLWLAIVRPRSNAGACLHQVGALCICCASMSIGPLFGMHFIALKCCKGNSRICIVG